MNRCNACAGLAMTELVARASFSLRMSSLKFVLAYIQVNS
jgi:hypothetical protein